MSFPSRLLSMGFVLNRAPLEMSDAENRAEIKKYKALQQKSDYNKIFNQDERRTIIALIRVHKDAIKIRKMR
jgi:hypothetical protein